MNENELKAKIRGLISGIEAFSAKEREKYPSDKFAENYNRVIASAGKFIDAEALPPKAHTVETQFGGFISTMAFCEMLAHMHELRELIDSR